MPTNRKVWRDQGKKERKKGKKTSIIKPSSNDIRIDHNFSEI